MRILYATTKAGSGNDVYYSRLSESMNRLGVESKIISYRRNLGVLPVNIRQEDSDSCDIVHLNAGSAIAFKKRSRPLVVTVLHVVSDVWKQAYLSYSQKVYYSIVLQQMKKSVKDVDFVITISKSTENAVRDLFGITNVQTVHAAIDTEIFKPEPRDQSFYPDKTKLLFVGNLTTRKGVDLLPRIMEKLDNQFLLFYTTGLRTKKRVFADNRMIPLGRLDLPEMVKMYNSCDILVMPSRLEGFGYSAAEAMACGKPVVATNCSSIPELVDNEKGGFLCEMDNVNEFAQKIKILASDSELREKMGKHNRSKVLRDFELLQMGRKHIEIYKRLVK
jgi:glycosyltransferase involved in cell wall biosynthesis